MAENMDKDEFDERYLFIDMPQDGEIEIPACPACPTPEHQALWDIYSDTSTIKSSFLSLMGQKPTSIFWESGRGFAIKLVDITNDGALALTDQGFMIIIRGTILHDPLQPPDEYMGKPIISNMFQSKNGIPDVVMSKQLSIPLLAAKGQIVEGGLVVMSPAYTEEQLREVLERGGEESAMTYQSSEMNILGDLQPVWWPQGLFIMQDKVSKIKLPTS